MRIARRPLLAALTTFATPSLSRAQDRWPNRPVRIIVPFPPGGSNDVVARPLADRLQQQLGQPFVIDNRGGAGGSIGATAVAAAPADGYTLMVTSSSFSTSAVIQRTSWDAEGSFDAIAILARAAFFLMVNPGFAARDVQQLVAMSKAQPGSVDYGTSGAGGINHFITEYFCQRAGVRMNHIPYRGTAPAVTDLVAGTIQLMITTIASANAPIREGRVRLIAATTDDADFPEGIAPVPTVKQQGIDYDVSIWWGLLSPKGVPAPIRQQIHAATQEALRDANLGRIYAAEGARPVQTAPDEFARVLRADMDRWRQVAQSANIRLE